MNRFVSLSVIWLKSQGSSVTKEFFQKCIIEAITSEICHIPVIASDVFVGKLVRCVWGVSASLRPQLPEESQNMQVGGWGLSKITFGEIFMT